MSEKERAKKKIERGGGELENKRGEYVLLRSKQNHSCLVTLLVICYKMSMRGGDKEERGGGEINYA